MFGPLEDAADLGLFLTSNAFCDNRLKRAILGVNARWKPKRNAEAVGGALRCTRCKRAFSKRSEQSRDVQQILMRVVIHPARDRISAKGQNEPGDGAVDFGGAGNRRDSNLAFPGVQRFKGHLIQLLLQLLARTIGRRPSFRRPIARCLVRRSCQEVLRARQVRQIFIDRTEFFIAHSSDRLPRHLLGELMRVGIDADAHAGHEFLELPSLYKIEVGPGAARADRARRRSASRRGMHGNPDTTGYIHRTAK
jgi:hypothetical protein